VTKQQFIDFLLGLGFIQTGNKYTVTAFSTEYTVKFTKLKFHISYTRIGFKKEWLSDYFGKVDDDFAHYIKRFIETSF
jgi:hypothetical protein